MQQEILKHGKVLLMSWWLTLLAWWSPSKSSLRLQKLLLPHLKVRKLSNFVQFSIIVTLIFAGVSLRSMKLIKWKEERFCLIDHVSSRWKSFGLQLEIPYDKLEAWREECLGNASRCCIKVMGHWLAKGGTADYPATWEGLYLLLEDVEFSEVANKLRTIIEAS